MKKLEIHEIPIGLKITNKKLRFSDFTWNDGKPMLFTHWLGNLLMGYSVPFDEKTCVVIKLIYENFEWFSSRCQPFFGWNVFLYEPKYTADLMEGLSKKVAAFKNGFKFPVNMKLFQCENGEYIQFVFVCDTYPDCKDSSDENNCMKYTELTGCPQGTFQCDNNVCIPIDLHCDYRQDCIDGSDERYCSPVICNDLEWTCGNGQCINMDEVCDLVPDCIDGSDETDSQCVSNECGLNFRCYRARCIPWQRLNDVYDDCFSAFWNEKDGRIYQRQHVYSCGAAMATNKNNTAVSYHYVDFGYEYYTDRFVENLKSGTEVEKPFVCINISSTVVLNKPNGFVPAFEYISSSEKVYTEHSPYIFQLITKTSTKCAQWIKLSCTDEDRVLTEIKWTNGHGIYKASFKGKTSCRCPKSFKSDSCPRFDSSFCFCNWKESYSDVLQINNLEEDNYLLIDDKSILPVRKVLPDENGVKFGVIIGHLNCEEDVNTIPAKFLTKQNLQCKSGKWIYPYHKCLLRLNKFGDAEGCRDLTHLDNCANFTCPDDYFKCSNAHCIHVSLVCDGQKHCLNGEDEIDCGDFLCPGFVKCRKSKACLSHDMICDGVKQCPQGDDEKSCIRCPSKCTCAGLKIYCNSTEEALFLEIPEKTRYLNLSFNNMEKRVKFLSRLVYLTTLILSNCFISSLEYLVNGPMIHGSFQAHTNLVILDLSHNMIEKIGSFSFSGLNSLRKLILSHNARLKTIEASAFDPLIKLKHLIITNTALKSFPSNSFSKLEELLTLDVSFNRLFSFGNGMLSGLISLKELKIQGNPIRIKMGMFDNLLSMRKIYSSSYTFCCIRPVHMSENDCIAPKDSLSSCDDLLREEAIRTMIWIIAICALIGNCGVLIFRLCVKKKVMNISFSVFVSNLGFADMLMGVYLLIVASNDLAFRGSYVWHQFEWKHSATCQIAGVLATVSSEASVIFISLITLDRFLAMKYPFRKGLLSKSISWFISVSVWVITISIALIPIFVFREFYAQTSVCIALPLTSTNYEGALYSVFVFIIFNSVAFVFILLGQIMIYRQISIVSAKVRSKQLKRDRSLAMSLSLVALTDFLCWMPIGIMGLMAIKGSDISGDVYAWVITFVLPINTALNPLIYTFASLLKEEVQKRNTKNREDRGAIDIDKTRALVKCMEMGTFVSQNDDCGTKLGHHMEVLKIKNVAKIAKDLIAALNILHLNDMAHGNLSKDSVRLILQNEGGFTVRINMSNKLNVAQICKQDDIKAFGLLVRLLLSKVDVGQSFNRTSRDESMNTVDTNERLDTNDRDGSCT